MSKDLPNIPDSELEVLEALWQVGKATVREILKHLQRSGTEWSYATVSTLLQRLESKGLAVCDKTTFAHVYRASVSRPAVVERRLKSLIDKVYQGEPGLLVVHLLKSHALSAEHRFEIQKLMREKVDRVQQSDE